MSQKSRKQPKQSKKSPPQKSQCDQENPKIKLSEIIAPSFYDAHRAIKQGTHSEFWLKGGRGSTKSSFAAIEIIHGMMEDENANAIVFRKVQDTIRTSVLEMLLWAVSVLDVDHLWRHTVSPAEMIYIPTGQKIIFKGLDKPIKIKSIKLKKGYFKFSWFEELEEFNGMQEIRSVLQSITRGGAAFIQIFTYNPPNEPQSWVNTESNTFKNGRFVHHSTYQDVPSHWLGEKFIEEAEWLRENNFLAYEHEYLGMAVGIHEAIIFSGKCKVKPFKIGLDWEGPYFGVDWGFSQDPLVIIKCWLEPVGIRWRLYIENENFGVGVEIDDMPSFFEEIEGSKTYTIRADNARPETISHIANRGFSIMAADKWAGSVEDGITYLKNFVEIVIHTRCEKMQEEARLYSYKIDRLTKLVTPDIIDKFNHGWDAVRYALQPMIKERVMGFIEEQIKDNDRADISTIASGNMSEASW